LGVSRGTRRNRFTSPRDRDCQLRRYASRTISVAAANPPRVALL
jgi:hypothetical protein